MALETGTRIGVYEVTGKLGEGGMGEVYRAHDTTLDRDVALKVLSEAFTADPDRLARFQREAKVLASLNHPNIGGIYGLEAAGESQALVLELIEGPTLADRIAEGAIPVDDALTIATQIAEALEAAHEQGIIHRDLKPANVKVRPDGTVKVLDFGLAKAVHPEVGDGSGANNPTISLTGATQMGMVVGTAAYMAPEQAKGKPVDKRADIWAFGVVLLEMLGGKRVFDGETASETLAAVMMKDPSWEVLPTDLPATLDNVLHRCLEKDPRKRVRDIGDVRLAMEGAFETAVAAPVEQAPAPTLKLWQQPTAIFSAVVGTAIVSAVAVSNIGGSEAPLPTRFSIMAPEGVEVLGRNPIVAPDGRTIAFAGVFDGQQQVYVRALGELDATPVRGTDGGIPLSFSPDGQSVLFSVLERSRVLKKVPVVGGPPVTISESPGNLGASWGPDGTIVMGSPTGLLVVSDAGGEPRRLTTAGGGGNEGPHVGPQFLPNGRGILFFYQLVSLEAQVAVHSLDTGETTVLLAGSVPRFTASGHLVFARGNTLWAVPFDSDELLIRGEPVPVVEDVSVGAIGFTRFDVSMDGALVYIPGVANVGGRRLVWVDRNGSEEILEIDAGSYDSPRISPDGRYVAVQVGEPGASSDVLIHDIDRMTTTALTFDGQSGMPIWTLDGERIVFTSERDGGGMFWQAADGTGQAEQLTSGSEVALPYAWSQDGELLLAATFNPDTQADVITMPIDDPQIIEPLIQTAGLDAYAAMSADGRWVAYHSNEAGTYEVYVRPFPNADDGKWQVSRNGGFSPVWSPRGDELFYRLPGGTMMAVPIATDTVFTPGTPVSLFEAPYRTVNYDRARPFDLAPDGDRFLMIKDEATNDEPINASDFIFVENWSEELKERVSGP